MPENSQSVSKKPHPGTSIYLLNLYGKYAKSRNFIHANMHKPRNSSPDNFPSEYSQNPLPDLWQMWAGSARVAGREAPETPAAPAVARGPLTAAPPRSRGAARRGPPARPAGHHLPVGEHQRVQGRHTRVVVLLYPRSSLELVPLVCSL